MIALQDILAFLGGSLERIVNPRELTLSGVAAVGGAGRGNLSFCSAIGAAAEAALNETAASVVLCRSDLLAPGARWPAQTVYLGVRNPRLEFVRIYQHFFATAVEAVIDASAVIGRNCVIDDLVAIGPHAVIGDDVALGKGTRIGAGVFIGPGVRIGEHCSIHANTVIGEPGFGFERDSAGAAIPFPHLGRVVIGNRVSIGAHSCIARGALSDTVVEDDVQIDSHVHIAHNVRIGRAATIVAHASVSGSAAIEDGVWLSPGALVLGGTVIGAGAMVGIGAVVTKTVGERTTVFGNPARTVWIAK